MRAWEGNCGGCWPAARAGASMTRSGIRDRLDRAVATAGQHCPSLRGQHVMPHTLRHYVDGRVMWPEAASFLVAEPRVLVPAT